MADSTIHALTDGTTPASTDEFPVARSPYTSGNDRKITWAEIVAAMETSLTGLTIGSASWNANLANAAAESYSGTLTVNGTSSASPKTITGAADNGSGLIRITCAGHGFATTDATGCWVVVASVGGTTEANGNWAITNVTANTFDLVGSTFTHAYTSGGTVYQKASQYQSVFHMIANATSPVGVAEKQAILVQSRCDVGTGAGYPSNYMLAGGIHCQAWIKSAITTGLAQAGTFEALHTDSTTDGLLIGVESTVFNCGTDGSGSTIDTSNMKINYWGDSRGTGATKTITGAANNGAGLIRITCTGHGYSTGNIVVVANVGGVSAASGQWYITVIDANTFDLTQASGTGLPSAFSGTYTSGGTAIRNISATAYLAMGNTAGGWYRAMRLRHATEAFIRITQPDGSATTGIDMLNVSNAGSTIGAGAGAWAAAMKIPNNAAIRSYSADGASTYWLIGANASNNILVGAAAQGMFIAGTSITLQAAATVQGDLTVNTHNIVTDTTTGTKIGTLGGASGQKLGFYNATPIVQPLLATGAAHTVDDVITTLQNLGLVRQT